MVTGDGGGAVDRATAEAVGVALASGDDVGSGEMGGDAEGPAEGEADAAGSAAPAGPASASTRKLVARTKARMGMDRILPMDARWAPLM
jgi:hypothetical protein